MGRLVIIVAVTVGLAGGIGLMPQRRRAPAPVAGGKPQRIVCLAPSITETVFALGAGDRVVGVTKWCDYPPEAKTRTVVGGMGQPNLEVLVALQPDLILAPSFGKAEDYEKLRQLGYSVEVSSEAASLQAVADGICDVGRWIGEDASGDAIVERLSQDLWNLTGRMGLPGARPHVFRCALGYMPTCLSTAFVVGHDPLFVAGRMTFAHNALRCAGAQNVCLETDGWSQYSMESLLAHDPDVILDSTGDEAMVRDYWSRWPDLKAVKSGRVYAVDPNLTNRPGPRIAQGIEQMARLIHPEAFPKPEGGK